MHAAVLRPRGHRGRRGKGCPQRRKRSRCLDKRGHVSTKQALELKTWRQRCWQGSPRSRGPSLPVRVPRAHKGRSCVLRHLRSTHRAAGNANLLKATGRNPANARLFLEVEGSPAISETCARLYRRGEERCPRGTGSGRGQRTAPLPPPQGLTWSGQGSDRRQSWNPRPSSHHKNEARGCTPRPSRGCPA